MQAIQNPNDHPQTRNDAVDALVGFLVSFGLFSLMAIVAGVLAAFK